MKKIVTVFIMLSLLISLVCLPAHAENIYPTYFDSLAQQGHTHRIKELKRFSFSAPILIHLQVMQEFIFINRLPDFQLRLYIVTIDGAR